MKESIRKILREEVEIQNNILITEDLDDVMDKIQGALTVLGFGFDPADGVNAIISFLRSKWFDGIVNVVAMIPGVGSAISAGFKGLLKVFPTSLIKEVFSKIVEGTAKSAVVALVQASANNKDKFKEIVSGLREKRSSTLATIDKIEKDMEEVMGKLPRWAKKLVPEETPEKVTAMIPKVKSFFNELTTISDEEITAEMNKALNTSDKA